MKSIPLLILLAGLAHGRLGETREQAATRYGAAISSTETSTTHEHGGMRIDLVFGDDGKASEIRVAKLPSIMAGRYSPMPPTLIAEQLKNAQPGEWVRQPGRVVKETWHSPDGSLVAVFDHQVKILSIAPVK